MTTSASDPPQAMGDTAYRTLLDEVGAFVYATDIRGNFTFANKLVLELLRPGLRLEEAIGKAFTDFVAIGEDDTLRETDRRVLEQGETIEREEANLIHATGEMRYYWSTKKPLRDAGGAVVGMIGISHDITEKKRLEEQVVRQKDLLDTVLENLDALVYMKSADRRFVYANRQFARVFGQPLENILGRLDSELMPKDVADGFWAIDQQILASGQRYAGEQSLVDAQGRTRHYWSVVVPGTDAEGHTALIGLVTDITALHELQEELQQQARTDSLTGCANRRHFFELAGIEFTRSRRYGAPLSMIAIDIDHFKQINDRYGHPIGDVVLQDFVGCCRGILREMDVLARTGGEEFCILLPDTNLEAAGEIAERIRAMTETCHPIEEYPSLQISASFGASTLESTDADFQTMFARADRALYQAKDRGRNCTALLSGS